MADTPHDHGLENYKYPDRFGQWLGYRVLEVDRASHKARVELVIREDHLSPAKKVHGGVVAAFFDYAFGAATFSTLGPKDYTSTVELKVNYLRPIDLGDTLTAETEAVFKGKRLCVLRGMILRGQEPVAMGTATFNVVRARE